MEGDLYFSKTKLCIYSIEDSKEGEFHDRRTHTATSTIDNQGAIRVRRPTSSRPISSRVSNSLAPPQSTATTAAGARFTLASAKRVHDINRLTYCTRQLGRHSTVIVIKKTGYITKILIQPLLSLGSYDLDKRSGHRTFCSPRTQQAWRPSQSSYYRVSVYHAPAEVTTPAQKNAPFRAGGTGLLPR